MAKQLHTWGEIARHLDVSIDIAKRWATRYQLPVKKCGVVTAETTDLDQWVDKFIVPVATSASQKRDRKRSGAYAGLKLAMRDGRVVTQPCIHCGTFPAQAHHEDYDKPLDVTWLCQRHHTDRHVELRRLAGALA